MIIKICGVPYSVNMIEDPLRVAHSGDGASLWGEISYGNHSINILVSSPERELRTLLHEVLPGIIENGGVRALNTEGKHDEESIDQIANGYAEVLESMGVVFNFTTANKLTKKTKRTKKHVYFEAI